MTTWQFAAASVTKVTAADLATHVPGADLLPRPFLVRGSGGPAVYQFDSPPPLWATASADDTPTTLTVGEARAVTFQFQNHGSLAWKPGEVFLAPANPRDHASPLCDAASWKSCQRAVTVSAQTAPGETGSFALTLRAPDAAGTVKECFNLVYADRHWFSDVGQMGPKDDALCRSIDVVAAPAQPDAGEPVVAADAGGIPAGDDAGQDQGAHVDAGKPSAAVTAGCGCGAGGGLTAWPAAIALVGLLKRRRH
jgi:uncharacterized protein (TIGR03382 family)